MKVQITLENDLFCSGGKGLVRLKLSLTAIEPCFEFMASVMCPRAVSLHSRLQLLMVIAW